MAVAEDPHHTGTDRFTYTEITNVNPIVPQIAAAGGTVADAFATGLWPPMGIEGLIDDGNGGSLLTALPT